MNTTYKTCSFILLITIFLFACGGGGGGGNGVNEDKGGGNELIPPPGANANHYCPDNIVVNPVLVGNNIYEFTVGSGDCFGANADDALLVKKEVPLDIAATNDSNLVLSPKAKVTKTKDTGGTLAWFYIAYDITNNSSLDQCVVNIDSGAALLDDSDTELASFGSTFLDGDLYFRDRGYIGKDVRHDCIPAGETRTYTDSMVASNSVDLADVVKIVIGDLKGDELETSDFLGPLNSYAYGSLTATQFEWDVESTSIPVGGDTYVTHNVNGTATFINNLSHTIKITDNAVDFILFDEKGYVIYKSWVELHYALGLDDDSQLTADDYIIDASGGVLQLKYNYEHDSRFPQIWGSASKAVIHLEWQPEPLVF